MPSRFRAECILAFLLTLTVTTALMHATAAADDAGPVAVDAGAHTVIVSPIIDLPSAVQDEGVIADLYHKGLIVDAAIVVVFLGLQFAAGRWGWLKQDHHIVYATAGIAALTGLVALAASGQTPNKAQAIGAVITFVSLVINPKKTQAPPADPPGPPVGPYRTPPATPPPPPAV